jgi:CubicO group peptidase (beta-lactamase class C family)
MMLFIIFRVQFCHMKPVFSFILFLAALTVAGQSLPVAQPEALGLSSQRLQRIDKTIQQAVDSGWISGAGAMIMRNGKVAYHKSFGYTNTSSRQPLKKDAIFRIASQTKAITSVAAMMLYEEGKFLLDEPVSKYLPEYAKQPVLENLNMADTTYTTVPSKRDFTIRELLTHTSGLGYAQIGSREANAIYLKHKITAGIGTDRESMAADMKRVASLPLMHQPGEKYTYGLNTDVLGYLVEVVSGQSLDEFFRKRIFEPLGMNDTYFYLPPSKYDRLVSLHLFDPSGKLIPTDGRTKWGADTINGSYPKTRGTYYSGGAGLSSTLEDYAKFLQMMLNGGTLNGKRILSRHTVRMMTMNQIGDLAMGHNKFGLGFGITTEKGSSIIPTPEGTYDWGGAFQTTYWVDPKEKINGLIYRQQLNDPQNLGTKFKVLVYQAVE